MTFGWNSLESVSTIHRGLEIAGFVFLGLLLVSEVLAFVYGNRKDVLSEQVTTGQIETIRASQRPRRLSDKQKQALIAALLPYKGEKVSVARIMGDGEAEPLANDFVDVFVRSGWSFRGKPEVVQSVYDKDPIGIEVTLNQGETQAGRILPGASALITSLAELGIIKGKDGFVNPETPSDLVEVRVGKRPPSR
jgi:hypothetical protein